LALIGATIRNGAQGGGGVGQLGWPVAGVLAPGNGCPR
jgi:hypothetical protein